VQPVVACYFEQLRVRITEKECFIDQDGFGPCQRW